jgi:hypothetical protein
MSDATRRTLRTALAVLVAVCAVLPAFVTELGMDAEQAPWLAALVAAAAAITRIMQTQAVDAVLTRLGLGRQGPPDKADG